MRRARRSSTRRPSARTHPEPVSYPDPGQIPDDQYEAVFQMRADAADAQSGVRPDLPETSLRPTAARRLPGRPQGRQTDGAAQPAAAAKGADGRGGDAEGDGD